MKITYSEEHGCTIGSKFMTVSLDGVDVTNDVREADEEAGTVTLLKRDEHSHRYLENGHPAVEVKRGVVRIGLIQQLAPGVREALVSMYPSLGQKAAA